MMVPSRGSACTKGGCIGSGSREALATQTKKREFEIIALSDEQIRAEEKQHALWVKYVGSHCDYDENNKRTFADLKPKSEWENFYSLPVSERNYTNVVKVVSEEGLWIP
jgi:hypothetical protein